MPDLAGVEVQRCMRCGCAQQRVGYVKLCCDLKNDKEAVTQSNGRTDWKILCVCN